MTGCMVAECTRPARTVRSGLCAAHHQRLIRHGSVRAEVSLRPFRDPHAQIFGKTDAETLPGCLLWTGRLDDAGYGYVHSTEFGRPIPAYRAAYLLIRGPIPAGLHLDHLCHTNDLTCLGGATCLHRRCINPDHLEPVTPAENHRRARRNHRNTKAA